MSKIVSALLFVLVIAPAALYAQAADTVYVPNDLVQGTINNVIQGDTLPNGARVNPNRVYKLHRGGYYILNGNLVIQPGTHITIIGAEHNEPNVGADSGMAILIPGPVLGGYYNYNIDCFGDLTMKHVWLMYSYTDGTLDWMVLQFEQNQNAQGFGDFEDCIFDYVRGIAVMANRTGFVGNFTNCIFRNNIDPSQWWAGRMFATYSSSATADSIYADNCTFENMGFAFQTDYIPPQRVWFNHNTFLNIAKFPFKFYYMTHLVCANNVFMNCHFSGERYADRVGQDPDLLLYGAVLDVDTIPTSVNYNNVADLDRVVLFYNNSNFTQADFQTYYDSYNAIDSVTTLRQKIQPEPMMNDRTLDMFTWHPHMRMANVYDGVDPGFVTPATNLDSIMAFLQCKYVTGGNVFWGYNPDLLGAWPLKENLTYTNAQLLTAATGGYPLGDLFHWFPTQYAAWATNQKAADQAYLFAQTLSVKTVSSMVPGQFTIAQNYPNPFNPATQIDYTVPRSTFVSLKVYNVVGQLVATLVSGIQAPGTYRATFDGARLSSGVYFYRLQAGDVSISKKMVLLK